jgi:hypothetical protein
MTHKFQSWDSVPLETMSDLISRKVVTGEKFREFRETPRTDQPASIAVSSTYKWHSACIVSRIAFVVMNCKSET